MMRGLYTLGVLLLGLGCDRSPHSPTGVTKPADAPKPAKKAAAVVPDGFDQRILDILRCPENLTVLRLATRNKLDSTNERIKSKMLKNWGDETVTKPVTAMLIRADEKIGYRFEGPAPVMIIEEALVLDKTVGKPDPDKHRK
jgi:uncharacterized protein YbaR (Trm112 family)